ncbi:small ribosomal subunit protein uS14m-like [Mytilus edulis]|uniref:small ribosomal subunit protein uS14m-like n=1 Tax=Mytilus edulis TaxID=6550 RepID=UPI0039F13735
MLSLSCLRTKMAASIVNRVAISLRNTFAFNHSKTVPLLSKPLTESFSSPWKLCTQIRTCADTPKEFDPFAEPKFNHQKRLLKWAANRDFNNRKLIKQYGPQRLRLVTMKKSRVLPHPFKELVAAELHELPRRSSVTHTFPRCILTGKARGRLRRWRLSRIQWRILADYNNLSGVTRAQW